MLRVRHVTHRYGRNGAAALRDVDLTIKAGERVAIIGESGSGKSTLLMALAGLLIPTEGSVLLDNTEISKTSPADRNLSLVFQTPPAMPNMRIRDLLRRPAQRDGVGVDERIAAAMKVVRLEGPAERRISELSGGERQRAFLARALVWRPRLMLLDEPFSNIDVRTKRAIIPQILAHQAASAAALVIITHDPEEAALVADRYVLLHAGAVVSAGPTATAASDPKSAFGALVFRGGTANLVPGRLSAVASDAGLELFGTTVPGTTTRSDAPAAVSVLISPLQLRLMDHPAPGWIEVASAATMTWTPAHAGAFAIAYHGEYALYATDERSNLTGGIVAVERVSLPLFDLESGIRVGNFKVT